MPYFYLPYFTYQPYITNLGKVTYHLIFTYTLALPLPLPKFYLIYNLRLIYISKLFLPPNSTDRLLTAPVKAVRISRRHLHSASCQDPVRKPLGLLGPLGPLGLSGQLGQLV